jgi:nucleoside-diphosphate kinase
VLFRDLLYYMTSGPVVALELMSSDAVQSWRQLLGPTDPLIARIDSPQSVRAKVGKDKTKNAAHGSDSAEAATRV